MNLKTKLILATAAVALFAAPASARFDGDEGAASAYPQFGRAQLPNAASAYASGYVVQPGNGVRQHLAADLRPRR
ncbi:MAG: hypothetical protein K2Y71_23450 [Xanthobacteraceae bacterium]|nr:hypothetical protein [Xanthobacteraceae bacterium]